MRKPTQRAQLVKVESGDGERRGKRRDSVSLFPVSFFPPVPRENLTGKKLEGKKRQNQNIQKSKTTTHPTNAPHHATFFPAAPLNAPSSLAAAPAYALIVGSPRGVSASMANTGERVVPSRRLTSREAER